MCDGASTGHTSRIERTMRQHDCIRGGGRSWRMTELTMEQKVTAVLDALAIELRSSRLWLLHHRRLTQVWESRSQSNLDTAEKT
jgi:hypothetical protein